MILSFLLKRLKIEQKRGNLSILQGRHFDAQPNRNRKNRSEIVNALEHCALSTANDRIVRRGRKNLSPEFLAKPRKSIRLRIGSGDNRKSMY